MPKEPLTNKQAIEYLVNKKIVPTEKTAAELVESWTARDRAEALFSARVNQADVLEAIRGRIKQVIEGGGSSEQAFVLIRKFLLSDGKSALQEMGFLADEADMNANNRLSELGSARRLKLIIEQNVRNAQAAAEYDGFVEEKALYPYVEYHTAGDERVRVSHAALDGKVYEVGTPEMRAVSPPNDFRCRCYWLQLTRDELAGRYVERDVPPASTLSPSGFTFDPGLKPGEQLPAVIPAKPKTQPRKPVTSPVTPEPERAPLELPTGQATAEIIKPLPPKKQWQPDIASAYQGTTVLTDEIKTELQNKARPKFTGQIIKNIETGQEIKMSYQGAKKSIRMSKTVIGADFLDSAVDIAATGNFIGFEKDFRNKPNVTGYWKYVKMIPTRIGMILVQLTVRETKNDGNVFYFVRKKEKARQGNSEDANQGS